MRRTSDGGAVSGRYGRIRAAGPALALLAALSGCGPAGTEDAAIQRLLDDRAAAVLGRDPGALLAGVDPAAAGYRARQRLLLRNLAAVPLASWDYRVTGTGGFEPAPGHGRRVAADVRLSYRLEGHDTAPVTVDQRLTLTERDGRWYVAAEHPSADGPEQLWEQGEVAAVRGSRSLVLGVGQDRRRLRAVARTADGAVPAVDAAWHGRWARRVVVLVPGSPADMAGLTGDPPGSYRGIAAVTSGETGGSARSAADRVIVNPEAYGVLGASGQRVVLTHETAHVATRANTSSATPLWLSEGFADWVAYRGTADDAARAAPELTREIAAGHRPRGLPPDGDFAFAGNADRLALAYESGWLACRMVADEWGEEALVAFYRAVAAAGTDRTAALETALRDELGVAGPEDFTARWRAYVSDQLS